MNESYHISDASEIITPGLVIFRDVLEQNIHAMQRIAGNSHRLRPHCKTHKMREVTRLLVNQGVTKHKCATFAEAEMLVQAGVDDIFLAYSLVGPNVARAVAFVQRFPQVSLRVTADHEAPIAELGRAMNAAGESVDVLLDLDTGQNRSGVPVGKRALGLYRQIVATDGLSPGGLHLYDGQNHQTSLDARRAACSDCWQAVSRFRDELVDQGWACPRIVAGGTGSFPMYAGQDDPALELSPGTCVFHDAGYAHLFPDLAFRPAALILTRVISRPTDTRVTFDLGYKACASDPPAGQRLVFPGIPDAREVLQNEEHLVIETCEAERFAPGDEQLAIPWHICPTTALHKHAWVIEQGKVADRWAVAARDRWLTI